MVAALCVDAKTDIGAAADGDPEISTERWTMREALQTPQFWIIAAAYAAFQFCGITASSVSVAHLTQHGVAAVIAGSMMSVEALLNSGARLAGGILTRFVSAKTLAGVSLASLVVGHAGARRGARPAHDAGLCRRHRHRLWPDLFSATILLLDYFGRGPYLELFSIVNLISTVGAVAPTLAGLTRDRTGSFTPFFIVLGRRWWRWSCWRC